MDIIVRVKRKLDAPEYYLTDWNPITGEYSSWLVLNEENNEEFNGIYKFGESGTWMHPVNAPHIYDIIKINANI